MARNSKPILALTMGDAAGVGPELCLRMLNDAAVGRMCVPVVVGSLAVLARVSGATGIPLRARRLAAAAADAAALSAGGVLDMAVPAVEDVRPGEVSAACGAAAYAYVRWAVNAALARQIDGIVTAPVNKASLSRGGVPYPGHTEMLADLTRARTCCMMMTSPALTVSLVTWHIALAQVPRAIGVRRIVETIRLTADALPALSRKPRAIGVCGLNPHAGDGGLFGDEERRIVAPAVARARAAGVDCEGPLPPDTAFLPQVRKRYGALVCLYHDQGLIPFKMLAFETGVNVTLGLPIVRTSVDHGTAFDIAWKGAASPSSFRCAIETAVRLSRGLHRTDR